MSLVWLRSKEREFTDCDGANHGYAIALRPLTRRAARNGLHLVSANMYRAQFSIFVLIMNTSFFPLGIHKLCALDFKEENLATPRVPFRQRWRKRLHWSKKQDPIEMEAVQPELPVLGSDHGETEEPGELGGMKQRKFTGGQAFGRMTSRAESVHSMLERTRPIPSTAPLDAIDVAPDTYRDPVAPPPRSWTSRIVEFLKGLVTPVSCAIVIAIPCAIVQPLKALFVDTPNWSGTRVPFAPDGRPPLAFVMETAQFIGGITVPSALILLGASFARLKVPARWRDTPIAAIVMMTIIKSEWTSLISADISGHHARIRNVGDV